MKHIVLLGDSIFDNASYVAPGESVEDLLRSAIADDTRVSLLAVDGAVSTDVHAQLEALPADTTHVFLSCGGNDALGYIDTLTRPVSSVAGAMDIFTAIRETFRQHYRAVLEHSLSRHPNLAVCTIYDSVPDIGEQALTALALFNEVILKEAVRKKCPILDLRLLFDQPADYSPVSSIEPSGQGAGKLARLILKVVGSHDEDGNASRIHI